MLQNNKHREIIYHIIEEIFSGEYRTNLAIRGDILPYFIYGLDRFVTDISIDMVRNIPDESRFQIYIESVLMKYGKIKQKTQTGSSFFYIMNYGENDENIKVEIYTKIWIENLYEIVNLYGLELLAQEKSTIFAHALADLVLNTRVSGCDLYDIYFFFQNHFPVNHLLVKERTGKNLRECLVYLLEIIEKKVSPDTLLDELENTIDIKQKVFVQEKLLSELVILVQSCISHIK